MEDYIGIIIAAIIGITSLIASQKKKQQKAGQTRSGTTADEDGIDIEALEAELSLASGNPSQKAQPSAMDIIGKILTGDFSDLIPPTPTPPAPVIRNEYIDPVKARNRKTAERDALLEQDRIAEKARKMALTNTQSMLDLIKSGNKAAVGEAIILGEIFNKPVSMRNKRNVMR